MAGCLSAIFVWFVATAVLFWLGPYAEFEPIAATCAGGALATFVVQLWLLVRGRARHRRLMAEYALLYGPFPDEFKAWGTRAAGTAGRMIGGTAGYVVGGLVGAAADAYQARQQYAGMSEPQLALIYEINRAQLVRPVITSVMMVGALIVSWLLVVFTEPIRNAVGF